MGLKEKTVGGQEAAGLGNSLLKFLESGLNNGSFGGGSAAAGVAGANPVGSTQGIAGVLNDLLSGGGGQAGSAMAAKINQSGERQVNQLRARFGADGGTAFGTGAQNAEGQLRSQMAIDAPVAINQMQMSALMPLLQMMAGLGSKGISQRETVMQPDGWMQAAQLGGQVLGAGADIYTGMKTR